MSFAVFGSGSLPLRRTVGVLALLAGFLVGNSVSATQISLATPADLNPGDTFRFVFVTNRNV